MSADKEYGSLELTREEADNLGHLLAAAAGRLDGLTGNRDAGDVLMELDNYLTHRQYGNGD